MAWPCTVLGWLRIADLVVKQLIEQVGGIEVLISYLLLSANIFDFCSGDRVFHFVSLNLKFWLCIRFACSTCILSTVLIVLFHRLD